jgi:hypothetical protein
MKNDKAIADVAIQLAEVIELIGVKLGENTAWPLPAALFAEAIAEQTGLKTPLVSYLVNLYLPKADFIMRHGVGGGIAPKDFVMEKSGTPSSHSFTEEQTNNIIASVDRQVATHIANFNASKDKKHADRLFVREMSDELARGMGLLATELYTFVSEYVSGMKGVKIVPGRFGGILPEDYISENAAKKNVKEETEES